MCLPSLPENTFDKIEAVNPERPLNRDESTGSRVTPSLQEDLKSLAGIERMDALPFRGFDFFLPPSAINKNELGDHILREDVRPSPLRFAMTGAITSMNSDSLQPFVGEAVGMRAEYWFRKDMAILIGFQQNKSESIFAADQVDPLRDDFKPLDTRTFRDDSLVTAELSKRETWIPIGFRFVPFERGRWKVFTGAGVVLQKAVDREVWLTFFHREHFPPWPPREYEYRARREPDPDTLKLSLATFELGGRFRVTSRTELELNLSYQRGIKPDLSPYDRRRAFHIGSGIIFSF